MQNKAPVYNLLFRAASETMTTVAADPKHPGAKIGLTAVLHTWGSALTHHPHVHMIVPGGDLSMDGTRWVSARARFLLPVQVLAKLFRRLFLEGLIALHDAGRLGFFGDRVGLGDRRAFLRHLTAVRKAPWVVYAAGSKAIPKGGPLPWGDQLRGEGGREADVSASGVSERLIRFRDASIEASNVAVLQHVDPAQAVRPMPPPPTVVLSLPRFFPARCPPSHCGVWVLLSQSGLGYAGECLPSAPPGVLA